MRHLEKQKQELQAITQYVYHDEQKDKKQDFESSQV